MAPGASKLRRFPTPGPTRTGFTLRAPSSALFSFNNRSVPARNARLRRIIGLDSTRRSPIPRSLSNRSDQTVPRRARRRMPARPPPPLPRTGHRYQHAMGRLDDKTREWVYYGDRNHCPEPEPTCRRVMARRQMYGVKGFFEWRKPRHTKCMSAFSVPLPLLHHLHHAVGKRLQPEALCFQIQGKTLPTCGHAVNELLPWSSSLQSQYQHLKSPIHPPPHTRRNHSRIGYLDDVGLGYLTLDRATAPLRRRVERVNLTTASEPRSPATLFVLTSRP